MRRLLWIILLVLALVAVACGGDDATGTEADDDTSTADDTDDTDDGDDTVPDDSADDTVDPDDSADDDVVDDSGDDAPLELTASWRGVTEDTIHIGVAGIDAEAVKDFGVELDIIDAAKAYRAFAAAYNEAGGAYGRMIEIHAELFLPVGSIESERACTVLTEDIEIFIASGQMLNDNPLCFTELHDTPYVGSFGLTDERDERSNGQFYAYEMNVERQRGDAITALAEEGRFDGARVGLFWEEGGRQVVNDIVKPLLDEFGVDVVAEAELLSYADDTAASEIAADAIFQRFIAEDADLLINVSGLVAFNRAVERNFYEGQLVFLNGQQTNRSLVGTSGYDPDILIGAYGATAGKPTPEELLEDDLWLECVDELNASGEFDEPFVPGEVDEIAGSIAQICGTWTMIELMLEAAGPELTPDTFRAGAESLGEFELPGLAAASLGPDDHSAGDAVRVFEYDPAEVVFVPVGDPVVIE